MTCIAAIAREGRVYMGGDTCASDQNSWQTASGPKVFTVQDRFLLGVCGSFRVIDLLRFSLSVPEQPHHISDDQYMRTIFIEAVRKLLKDNNASTPNFLCGYHGHLYEIQDDYSVLNAPDWGHSAGSGNMTARGVLFDSREEWDSVRRIRRALEAAEATTPSVRGPFAYLCH